MDNRLEKVNRISELAGLVSTGVSQNFSRKGKEYHGIFALDDKDYVRFEFINNNLKSVAIWDIEKYNKEPPREILIIDTGTADDVIASAIKGSNELQRESLKFFGSRVLQESAFDDVRAFLNDPNTNPNQSVSKLHQDYIRWADVNGAAPASMAGFRYNLKKMETPTGDSGVGVKTIRGIKDDPSPEEELDDFEKGALANDVLNRYELMFQVYKNIITWDPMFKNAFVYGVGGVGKSNSLKQVIKQYGNPEEITIIKGTIAGFTGLLQALWENRDHKILILDDCDSILEKNAALNILKAAMDSDEPRIISYKRLNRNAKKEGLQIDTDYLDKRIVEVYQNGVKVLSEKITESQAAWYKRVFREADINDLDTEDDYDEDAEYEEYSGDLDPNEDPAYGMGADEALPDSFQFAGRIIFISNLLQVPQPLLDRCITVGLILNNEQIADIIEDKLESLLSDNPDVTIEEKRAVMAFMRKYGTRQGTKQFTFRLFAQLAAIYHSGMPKREEMMYMVMKSEGMKTKMR